MDEFCRSCLAQYSNVSDILQYTEKNRRLFVYATGLQVKRNDILKFQLCRICYTEMKVACKFKKKSRKSDKLFKNYLNSKGMGIFVDFYEFLKHKDHGSSLSLPSNMGYDPQNFAQVTKQRDDDTESKCTSIGNFLTDIINDEDFPECEANIIQEVIKEEADILDDTIESIDLQDDSLIDTDFKMNDGLPSKLDNDPHNSVQPTPNQREDETESKCTSIGKYLSGVMDIDEIPDIHEVDGLDNRNNSHKIQDDLLFDFSLSPFRVGSDNSLVNSKVKGREANSNAFSAAKDSSPIKMGLKDKNITKVTDDGDFQETPVCIEHLVEAVVHKAPTDCTIDKNLQVALNDVKKKEFSLDGLLKSPEVNRPVASPTSSIIRNILYGGDKAEDIVQHPEIKAEKGIDDLDSNCNLDSLEQFLTQNESHENTVPEYNEEQIKSFYDEDSLHCKKCNRFFKTLRVLKIHFTKIHNINIGRKDRKLRHKYQYTCDRCGKEYYDHRSFNKHMRTKHQIITKPVTSNSKTGPSEKSFVCDFCLREFLTKSSLMSHMKAHLNIDKPEPRMICETCGSTFTKLSNLQRHKLSCTFKRKEVTCTICGKMFSRKIQLEGHMRTHTNERPYSCKECDMKFSRSDSLTLHVKRLHSGMMFRCENCNSTYPTKRHLEAHKRKSVRCKNILIKKQLLAKGEIVQCEHCKKIFKQSETLKRHQARSRKCNPIQQMKKRNALLLEAVEEEDKEEAVTNEAEKENNNDNSENVDKYS